MRAVDAKSAVWRRASVLCVALGAVVFQATLRIPFWRDDLLQRAMARGTFPAPRHVFDMYDFVRPGERDALVRIGALPWWTSDDLRIRFFRPLSSALLFFEHRWFGSPWVMHVLSMAWWASAVFATSRLLRRMLAPRHAALATLIFALAPCHALPLAHLAQRDVLVTLTFGALGLERCLARRYLLAGASFAVAMLAGEYALCFGGYVLAIVASRTTSREQRIRGALAFAVPAVVCLITRALLGYGATGTGFYHDPFESPIRFVAHAPQTFCTLAIDAWSTFDAGPWSWWWQLPAAICIVGFLMIVSVERWLVVGSFMALVPVVASPPDMRLLGPAMIGIAAALAAPVDRLCSAPRVTTLIASGVAIALHLVHAPLLSWHLTHDDLAQAELVNRREESLRTQIESHQGTVVIALANWDAAYFGEAGAGSSKQTHPWRVLVTARHALMLRVDSRTVDLIVPIGQGFFPVGADDVFRPEDRGLHTGDVRDVPGIHVRVVSDGTTTAPRIRFTFDRALEDASLLWLTESVDRYRASTVPAIGFGEQLWL
jgi:hypothetical protein